VSRLALLVVAGLVAVPTAGSAPAPRDGTLDPTFGRKGTVMTRFGADEGGEVTALLSQPDGKIVAAGVIDRFDGKRSNTTAVARYRENGSLDPAFGRRGLVRVDLTGMTEGIVDLTRQADGKLVAVGYVDSESDTLFATRQILLLRLRANGTLDPAFGNGGIVLTDLPSSPVEVGVAVEIASNGEIMVGGQAGEPFGARREFVILRYRPDGALDTSFPVRHTAFAGRSALMQDMTLDRDGRIIAVGSLIDPSSDAVDSSLLVRYLPSGEPDPAFGADGRVTIDDPRGDFVDALTVQPDGKIVAAGSVDGFAAFRFTPSGAPDPTFGVNGEVATGFFADATSVLYRRGKLVLAGWDWGGQQGPHHFALARLDARDGTLDRSFGVGGKVSTRFPAGNGEHVRRLVVDRHGRLVAAGDAFSDGTFQFALARYRD
jgi:uncharacterized delta-60 repeat protein